jgi:hypothetical protein
MSFKKQKLHFAKQIERQILRTLENNLLILPIKSYMYLSAKNIKINTIALS